LNENIRNSGILICIQFGKLTHSMDYITKGMGLIAIVKIPDLNAVRLMENGKILTSNNN